MKLTTFLLLINFVSMAATVYSQPEKVTIQLKDASMKDLFNNVEHQTSYKFLYRDDAVENIRVSLNEVNMPLDSVLNQILEGSKFSYKILANNLIVIAPNELLQQTKVSGTVKDETGNPLQGVTVQVKGTAKGVITDADGKYSLIDVPENAALSFSFVGMETQEIPLNGRIILNVVLKEAAIGLKEVVVIGYGTAKKSDLTGAVVRINMTEKAMVPNVNVVQALQGSTAGVNVTGGGRAGVEQEITIRGRTSLSASDQPLVVLDGIIYNGSLSDINPSDVESVDILKDASAAAVYGSKAANGVLLITTKKGESTKPLFNINAYTGLQDMTNTRMKVMNAEQYAVKMVDYNYQTDLYNWYAKKPTSATGKPVRPDITNHDVVALYLRYQEEKDNYLAGNSIDWIKEVTRIAPIQNFDISVSGKTDKSNYFLSSSYMNQEGIMLNDQFHRVTVHSKIENKITDWFTLGLSSSYSYRDYSGLETSMNAARAASPLANMYDAQGNYVIFLLNEGYQRHPLSSLEVNDKDLRNNLFVVFNGKIDIPKIKGLTYNFDYSNTFYVVKNNDFFPASVWQGTANNGLAIKNYSEERDWITDNILSYSRTLANDHNVNATMLYSREHRQGENSNIQCSGFQNPILGYNNLSLADNKDASSGAWEENSLSFMVRANYSYKSRYLITGTFRKDGYSGFGANKKFASFPSLSLAWITSQEPFLKNIKWIDFLKLRISVGKNGNQGIGRYSSFSKTQNQSYVFGTATAIGVVPSTLGNPDLGWESTLSYNIGLDYIFLGKRISGEIDLYKALTSDVLVSRNIPITNGFSSVWTNIGGIENNGIELGLTTVNLDGPFRWETKFSFSLNRDKITKLYGGANDIDLGNSWFVGKPISAIYDYVATGGVWTEEELYNNTIPVTGFYPGHFRYADLNNDGNINPNYDRDIIGYKTPNYRFGITNTLTYMNFLFSFFINSIQGGNGYYLANNTGSTIASDTDNDTTPRRNSNATRPYWTPDNGVTDSPGVYYSPARKAGIYEDRSFVRLQDISLSYRFNSKLLSALGLSNLNLYVSGKNLYTWTKWSGWDPELGDSNSWKVNDYPDYSGSGWSGNPQMMRSIVTGVNVSF